MPPLPTRRTLLIRLAAVIALGLAASWAVGGVLMRPTPSRVPPASLAAFDIALRSTDGLELTATYWPGRTPNGPAVLLLHGNGASRASMGTNGRWLAANGYAALALDLRGHGGSGAARKSFGFHESRDAAAGVRWLRGRGHEKVAVIGSSLGGAAALLGEGGPVETDAMVLQAVYPDTRRAVRNRIAGLLGRPLAVALEPLLTFQARPRLGVWPSRLSPLAAVRRYRKPLLVIGGSLDSHTSVGETRAPCRGAGSEGAVDCAGPQP